MTKNDGDRRFRRLPSIGAARAVFSGIWRHQSNATHRLQAITQATVVQARWRLFRKGSVVSFATSSKILVRLDSGASKRAAYARLPDYPEMKAWQQVLKPGDLFVDIGANVGLYTLLACELGCEVIAVEPLADAADQLEANLRLNGYEARVVRAAIDEKAGTVSLAGPDDQRAYLSNTGAMVPALTLDELIGDRTVAGLKVDVEGAERRVLAGAQRALEDQRIALMQLEWNDRSIVNFGEPRQNGADLLIAAGYQLARPNDAGLLIDSDPVVGTDIFARPASTNESG